MGLEDSFIVDHSAPTSEGFESHVEHHHHAAPFRFEVRPNTAVHLGFTSDSTLQNYFKDEYSILLQNHMTEGEFRDIIQTSNNIVFRNFGSARKYFVGYIALLAAFILLLMGSLFMGIFFSFRDSSFPKEIIYFVPAALSFFLLVVGSCGLTLFLVIFYIRKAMKMETELRQYLDDLNNDHLLSRGLQIRLDRERVIDLENSRKSTTRLLLVIESIPPSLP